MDNEILDLLKLQQQLYKQGLEDGIRIGRQQMREELARSQQRAETKAITDDALAGTV